MQVEAPILAIGTGRPGLHEFAEVPLEVIEVAVVRAGVRHCRSLRGVDSKPIMVVAFAGPAPGPEKCLVVVSLIALAVECLLTPWWALPALTVAAAGLV
ncbi:hypothetical protein GCM10022214_01760 [Actinomadura miaoliensis]|uniref:Uncharacterized protein n=1 Tax=Actinomadura miaoliensis TaxID=430685 RepID=A0ABP7UYW0_9ACTN